MSQKLNQKQVKTLEKLVAKADGSFSPESRLFPQQLKFVNDKSRFKTAVCTRRSGKSVACAVDLLDTADKYPGTISLYITLSRLNGKRIIWPILLLYNRIYKLGGTTNETEVSMTFPNGSVIYIAGAKDKEQIEKFRGLAIKKVYLDEAQSFPPYIESLIDDVITPALFDYNGSLVLIGTPGPIPSGYFYEASQSIHWSHHFWSIFDNPFIEEKSGRTPQDLLEEELERRGVPVTNAKIQREFFGKWTLDLDSLVFKYEPKAHYDELPPIKWNYVMGVDLGFNDADAIAILAYSEATPESYLVHESVIPEQNITKLVEVMEKLIKEYKPEQIVMDTGGLGKKIAEEIRDRYSIAIKAADKTRKFENIELLNDAIRTQKFRAKKDSKFATDAAMVEWDRDKLRPDKLKVSDRYHSDICDAVLYAYRELYHWLYQAPKPEAKHNSVEYFKQVEADLESAAIERLEAELAEREPKRGISD